MFEKKTSQQGTYELVMCDLEKLHKGAFNPCFFEKEKNYSQKKLQITKLQTENDDQTQVQILTK